MNPDTTELKRLFDTELVKHLEPLKKQKNTILLIFLGVLVFNLLLEGLCIALFMNNEDAMFIGSGVVFLIFVLMAVFLSARRRSEYRDNYKNNIVREVIKLIDPALKYAPYGYIGADKYNASEIITARYNDYGGDDLIEGKTGNIPFSMSEIHVTKETRDSKGRKRTVTVFHGLFYVAGFNKRLKHKTLVLPDKAEGIFGSLIGKKLQSTFGRHQLVKLENPEFERLFVVYGTDQNEARYILTPKIMENMVKLKKAIKHPVKFSFKDDSMYILIKIKKPLFEPTYSPFKTLEFSQVKEVYELLAYSAIITEQLDLNNQIWGTD